MVKKYETDYNKSGFIMTRRDAEPNVKCAYHDGIPFIPVYGPVMFLSFTKVVPFFTHKVLSPDLKINKHK